MTFPRLALLTTVLLAHAAPLFAATVSIVQPAGSMPDVVVTLSRLRGELSSIGVAVQWVDRLPKHRPSDVDAVVAMASIHAPLAVEVWLARPPSGQPEVIRIAVEMDTKNAPETLALRTLEVLRANLFDVEWGQGLEARPTTEPIPRQGNTMSIENSRVGLEIGAAVLTSLDGIGPALLPTLRAGWAWRPRLVLQATLAGFGTRPTVANALGHARISQQYGLVGAGYRFQAGRKVMPVLSLSLGALRTSVAGQANGTATSEDRASQWSFLLDGGLGIALRLRGRLYATFGAHLQLAMPHVALHFMEMPAATTGRPNVIFVLTLGAWR